MSSPVYKPPGTVSGHHQLVSRMLQDLEGEVNMRSGRKWKSFVQVCAKLFRCAIYCANTRPEPNYHSGYLSCRGLGRKDPYIIKEHDIVAEIYIWPLIQPCTCKMGSSIFATMIWLKSVSTNRDSFPRIPSTERTKGE